MNTHFSFQRLFSVINKEFIQLKRDHLTFAMIVLLPLVQILLFGYAINTNPKNLPTAIVSADHTPFTRTYISAMTNTQYFEIINNNATEKEAEELLRRGKATFVVNIPTNFTRDLIRGEKPSILVSADGTDPSATSSALGVLGPLQQTVFADAFQHGLSYLASPPQPFNLMAHSMYNPEKLSQNNIVPGLLGIILTNSLIMITALSITRERERNTMENLLATPVQALEVMIGKIIPNIMVGYIQLSFTIVFATILFQVPFEGSVIWLYLFSLPFIMANLSIGLLFSTAAKNQLQAVQMTFFFFLPSVLLSGFVFPFYGMPEWAQALGNFLPVTHYLIIVRGIMLKGNGFVQIWPEMISILAFMFVVIALTVKRYKQTLD